jgi:hypothetical protein
MPPGSDQVQLPLATAGADRSSQAAAERLSQEANQSFLGGLESGFVDRANAACHHLLGTGLEIGSGIAIGAGLTLLSRNPEWLCGYAGKVAEYAPKAFGVVAASDLTWRALSARNSNQLGRNFGSALFDYPLMGLSGALGGGATMVLAGRPVPVIGPTEISPTDLTLGRTGTDSGVRPEGTGLVDVPRNVPKASDTPITFDRTAYIDGGDEGSIYNNGNGTITKVFKEPDTDVEKIVSMFQQLASIGVRLPEIMSYGKTIDGKPAMVMQMIGDGEHLQNQLLLGRIPAAEKPNLLAQYDAMAKALQNHGIRIDWQLKNMIWDEGKLYLVDPSFLKPEPLPQSIVDYMRPR